MKPAGAIRLHVEPITPVIANAYVEAVHRHHGPVGFPGALHVAAVDSEGVIRGVAIAGIPVAANRLRDGFRTLEVVRVATDGTPNACSVLYAACARAAKALGYSRCITYILDSETGTSCKAAGWSPDPGEHGNLSWTNRPGRTGSNFGPKGRWSLDLNGLERPTQSVPVAIRTNGVHPDQLVLSPALTDSPSHGSLLDVTEPQSLAAASRPEPVDEASVTGVHDGLGPRSGHT